MQQKLQMQQPKQYYPNGLVANIANQNAQPNDVLEVAGVQITNGANLKQELQQLDAASPKPCC